MKGMEGAVETILTEVGEDPNRQGLKNTPFRVAKMYREITRGYKGDPKKIINNAIFDVKYDEMVVVANIEYYSMCEHHLLPFFGTVHVGYVPRGKVVGLSKIPRLVEMYARRFQIQEQMTQQIADVLNESLNPDGVGVIVEGRHMCMMMRGVQKDQAKMVTSAMIGSFKDDEKTRAEFLSLIRNGGSKPF
jgi:GTP cyclohydrolase I